MDINKSSAFYLLEGIIGISLDIISNELNEFAGNTNHKIVFQIKPIRKKIIIPKFKINSCALFYRFIFHQGVKIIS